MIFQPLLGTGTDKHSIYKIDPLLPGGWYLLLVSVAVFHSNQQNIPANSFDMKAIKHLSTSKHEGERIGSQFHGLSMLNPKSPRIDSLPKCDLARDSNCEGKLPLGSMKTKLGQRWSRKKGWHFKDKYGLYVHFVTTSIASNSTWTFGMPLSVNRTEP